jgi:hypothetical protein
MMFKVVGRKLIIYWGNNLTISIEKRIDNPFDVNQSQPCFLQEIASFDGVDTYQPLGIPAISTHGQSIDTYLTDDNYWLTPIEIAERPHKEKE